MSATETGLFAPELRSAAQVFSLVVFSTIGNCIYLGEIVMSKFPTISRFNAHVAFVRTHSLSKYRNTWGNTLIKQVVDRLKNNGKADLTTHNAEKLHECLFVLLKHLH